MSATRIPIKGPAPEVEAMIQKDGFYLVCDERAKNYVIPMLSMGGKIFALNKGREIDPMNFLPTMKLSGPFVPATSES